MKIKKNILLTAVILAAALIFSGCGAKTAYEIAVKNGFSGTEQQWLESLHGSDGEAGKDAGFTVEELYQVAVENGYQKDILSFIKEYISPEQTDEIKHATAKAVLSAVKVEAYFTKPSFFGSGASFYQGGAGVIYKLNKQSGNALIITNYHVVYSADASVKVSDDVRIYVYGQENESQMISAEYVGGSQTYDIALLSVTGSEHIKSSNVRAVDVADSNDVSIGMSVVAVGNPGLGGLSASQGMVSVDSEYYNMTAVDGSEIIEFRGIRTDTEINPGNSGGGLFNLQGQLVGIVNSRINDSEIDGISYAIPSNIAVGVSENILWGRENGQPVVRKGRLGVELAVQSSTAEYDGELMQTVIRDTVVVRKVINNTLAVGKFKLGDVVTAVTIGEKQYDVSRLHVFVDSMLDARIGDVVTVSLLRDGTPVNVTLTLRERDFITIE